MVLPPLLKTGAVDCEVRYGAGRGRNQGRAESPRLPPQASIYCAIYTVKKYFIDTG